MIHSMPWHVGLRALGARPVTRGRVRASSGMAARTHGPWVWVVLPVAPALAASAALMPVLLDRGPPLPGYAVINRLSGVSFIACGLVAWRRRPDRAVGRLLTVAGLGV